MLRHTIRPALEALEARDVPSVTLQTLNNGHTLKITGNSDWEHVQIVQNDQSDTLDISYFLMPKPNQIMELVVQHASYSSSAITKIQIDLGQGNDSFNYSLADGTNLTIARQWLINMGAGDDSVRIDTARTLDHTSVYADTNTGKNGYFYIVKPLTPNPDSDEAIPADYPDTDHSLIQATLGMTINTGAGNDSVDVLLGEVASRAVVRLTTSLGDGDDYYSLISHYDIGERSTVLLDVNAGRGHDTVAAKFDGTISDGSLVDLLFRGGDGNDIMEAGLYGTLDGRFNLRMYGGAGHDNLSLITDTAPESTGQLSFMILGNAGHDIMTYQTLGADDPTLISALIDGGSNRNEARVSRDISCFNCTETIRLAPWLILA